MAYHKMALLQVYEHLPYIENESTHTVFTLYAGSCNLTTNQTNPPNFQITKYLLCFLFLEIKYVLTYYHDTIVINSLRKSY